MLNDIVYITFCNDKGESYVEEMPTGVEILRDMETDEITGLMIFGAKESLQLRQKTIDEMGFALNIAELL